MGLAERIAEQMGGESRAQFEIPPTIAEVATQLDVSRRTVMRLIEEGTLETVASDIGGKRVTLTSLRRYAQGQQAS